MTKRRNDFPLEKRRSTFWKNDSEMSVRTVVTTAAFQYPQPTASPTAATVQRQAAVVRPRTERPDRMIAPAPRKPTPATTCAAMRPGSECEGFPVDMNIETSMIRQEPTQTIM